MIDFIKINNLEKSDSLRSTLDFELKVGSKTGEIKQNRKQSAYIKNLVFTVVPGSLQIKVQGSIHMYFNNEKRNNNRFTLYDFHNVAEDLKDFISPEDKINVLEFGINLNTPFEPSTFIRNLVAFGNRPFIPRITSKECSAKGEYTQYLLKCYDKGLEQGPFGSKILRIELKYFKMENLFKDGLRWGDLNNSITWEYLGEKLKEKFSEVIYFDPDIDTRSVQQKEMDFLKEGYNPYFWRDLKGPHISRIRKKYKVLIQKHGKTFNQIEQLISKEIYALVNSDHFELMSHKGRLVNSDHFSDNVINKQLVNSAPLLYGQKISDIINSSAVTRICEVTGLNISMQKAGSICLNVTGLRYLFANDPDKYYQLKNSRLSPKYQNDTFEEQIKNIAHSIRNELYNPANNARRDIAKVLKDPALFDNKTLIKKDKLKMANLL